MNVNCLSVEAPFEIFQRFGFQLYGWHRAVTKVRETGIVFLTEGYKDTLAMHAAGFSNTVALCGTNLSEHHIAMIRKEAVTVCLFLDADEGKLPRYPCEADQSL